MIDIDELHKNLTNDCVSYPDPNAIAYRHVEAQIAIAEQLRRIADVMEGFAREGVPVVDASQESYTSLAETIAAQHDANLYR